MLIDKVNLRGGAGSLGFSALSPRRLGYRLEQRVLWPLGIWIAALASAGCGASSRDPGPEVASSELAANQAQDQRILVQSDFERVVLQGNSSATRAATALARYCPGYIGDETSFYLRVERDATLRLSARPTEDPQLDLMLAVMAPDGTTLCVDDADGIHPRVESAMNPGEYRIWVGGYEKDTTGAFTLEVVDMIKQLPQGPDPSPIPDGTYGGLSLSSGTGPGSLKGRAGGVRDANNVGPGCAGFLASKPDHVIFLEEAMRLQVSARGNGADLVLVLQSANGRVLCNDDAEGLSPHLEDELQAGAWNVYVGTFRPAQYPEYVLRVSR